MSAATRRLSDVLEGIDAPASARDIFINGLTLDSRRVQAGNAFIALRGSTTHGIAFAPAALALGASVIIAEAPAPVAIQNAAAAGRTASLPPPAGEGAERGRGEAGFDARCVEAHRAPLSDQPGTAGPAPRTRDGSAPIIWVENLRHHVGTIAARFFGDPSASLRVIGVTGTNGKTSIVQLLASALHGLGAKAATIGTLGAGMVGAIDAGERTTPDAISVQGLLAQFRTAGATDVAMEVSSHALDQGRVDAVRFGLAVFTNLTRDHLDYHGDMRTYGAAKAKLFAWPDLQAGVINVDDAFGRELADSLPAGVTRLRYALEASDAEIRAVSIRTAGDGLRFVLVTPWGESEVASPLLGRFNVANLLAVAGCLGALGYTFAQIHNAIARLRPVPGRMNRLGGECGLPLAVVDYSHTPDALEQALQSLRAHCAGQLVCVFGCGGERDQGKRPQMAAIAEALADRVIVTDDNPRGEDGDFIVAQIMAGFTRPRAAAVQRDRARAIALALCEARAGDVVLIAGKGHEPYQEIAGVKVPFDDLVIAQHALEARPC